MTDEMKKTEMEKETKPDAKTRMKSMLTKVKELANKRNFIILGSLVFIAGAIALNWYLFSDESGDLIGDGVAAGVDEGNFDENLEDEIGELLNTGGSVSDVADEDSYFSVTQLNRQRARDEAMEVLRLVLDSEDAVDEAKNEALASMAEIAADIEQEANIESLIVAKGFEECVAVLGSESASIIVKSDGLMQNQISQIKEIVYEAAGILPDQIKIIEKN
ncbi:MAG: SpoIIIAH-like family protein [Clostridia bacterium]|nr:SpoIIIAH-like family protein [Clostridia bacterium]